MKAEPRWISKKALVLLHDESVAHFGGARGVRDEGLLESALARPLNNYAYKPKSTIFELAAAYAFGLAKNHPFVDGNKRAAFLSIGLFLAINGYGPKADQIDAIQTMLSPASGTLTEEELATWIQQHAQGRRS
jgi:death on curing protein